ncbi:hypothetical protein FMEXI_1434 [Fusarium mexicanum]|uniref:Zn(2)-C6 fungal-type domain-containing protein n=1 Tax=Fusarium mexicanum TaxID=751941 RepID=A0A8H5JI74_9HYPO|nr:hypothetical protein FMEXI_1434 [Fusarium mexicanum]
MASAAAQSQQRMSAPLPRRPDTPSVCSFCQRTFTRRDALKRHWGICKGRLENGSEIPLLPAIRPRFKRPRACNRCVRLKRGCDRRVPCSTCSARNYDCSYERVTNSRTSVISERSSKPETNGLSQQEMSCGVAKAANTMPVVLTDSIDYSLEWLQCESLPSPVLKFDVWNSIYMSGLQLEPCFVHVTSREKLALPFLKRFTESSSIADGFDCGTLAQRRQLNKINDDASCLSSAVKTHEIVSIIKRTLTRPRLYSNVGIEWSPIVEKACLDFFSPCNLHRFLRLFWSGWYPNSPIIHKPTFNPKAESPGLIASMVVLGACLSPDSNDCVRAMAWLTPVEEVVFADNILYDDSIVASLDLVGDEAVEWDKLKALHAAYFICIAQNWEGSKEGRQRVRKDRYSRIVSIARSFGLYSLSLAKLDTTFPTQQKWARFILLESMIRTATYIYLLDSAFVLYYRLPPRVISLELNIGLVCPEACFQAESAAECFLQLHMSAKERSNQSRLTVSSAVRLLCSPHDLDLNMFHPLSSFNMFTLVSEMWKRVGFMQHANEYYHLACAMLERWKFTERQIGDTLAAWAAPLGVSTAYRLPKPNKAPLSSNPRHRKGLPKARTGCMTCRIRKIKCDEARPGCQRCIGTGRKCDGYGDTDSATKQTLIIRERPPITRALNHDLGVESSFHAFDYYRGHVSHQVGDTVDSDFWGDLVLRLAPTDAAIRHAISAISLIPAIVEYNKAILAVRSWPLATESRVKPLLVCLLFVCTEFMLGHEHQNAAKMHILQGRRLLANIKDRKTPETDIIRQYLAPIYLRLAYVGNGRVEVPRHLLQMTTAPLKFASLADARCVLYYLVDIGFTLIYEVKSYRSKGANEETSDTEEHTLQSRYKHLTRELANWRHAFEAYLAFSDLDGPDTRTAKLLTLRHCLMIVFLDSMISGSDYICDRNGLCDFSIATDCATFVVNHDNDIMQGPSFTFESEVVGPIYWIAAKCRQPVIRRRALELLYEREKTNRVESLTMVRHTIAMVTRVIEIEEEGLEIPLGTKHIQDYPNKYEVISREESCEWAESFLKDQKEQWPVLWDLGSHCSDVPTKLARITAAREQKELAEGLAGGWPR